jgi:hypothetical protein
MRSSNDAHSTAMLGERGKERETEGSNKNKEERSAGINKG